MRAAVPFLMNGALVFGCLLAVGMEAAPVVTVTYPAAPERPRVIYLQGSEAGR